MNTQRNHAMPLAKGASPRTPGRGRRPVVLPGRVRRRRLLLVALVVGMWGCGGNGLPEGGDEGVQDPAAAATAGGSEAVVRDLERTVRIAHEKLTALAEAMPEEDYPWRPMEGVRSVGDVFLHVASDNWFGPTLLGIAAPPETGVTEEDASVKAYQERTLSKDQIRTELEASFQHLLRAMEESAPRAAEEVSLRGNPLTVADLWVRLVVHMHEHLGQSIAYARSRGVVPPWSR